MSESGSGVVYDVFSPPSVAGGKCVAVFAEAGGDLQARAAACGAPLSVFLHEVTPTSVSVRVFTPTREKEESDSASIAALHGAQARGLNADFADVISGDSVAPAQFCGGEWLLNQGVVSVQDVQADLSSLHLPATGAVHTASTARPNLVIEVPTLDALDAFQPDLGTISRVNEATGTSGLVLYTRQAPAEGPQRRADVSFRCFGPLRGFLEDAASSNMLACLTGVLLRRRLLNPDENLLRAAQRCPGHPALLTVQYAGPQDAVWVGGKARPAEVGA
nr:PhzF family phenazine biosynthesis protein [Deinococcus cavernae]